MDPVFLPVGQVGTKAPVGVAEILCEAAALRREGIIKHVFALLYF